MEKSPEKIEHKINKYKTKNKKSSDQEKKITYLAKSIDYTKQLFGINPNEKKIIKLDFDDEIKFINTNLDKINLSIDESNKIYNMVIQVDSTLNQIVKKTSQYEKRNELIPYYLETISKIENFNL